MVAIKAYIQQGVASVAHLWIEECLPYAILCLKFAFDHYSYSKTRMFEWKFQQEGYNRYIPVVHNKQTSPFKVLNVQV